MSDSFREIELGNSSVADLARTSRESLVELHPGGDIDGENGGARRNSRDASAARSTTLTSSTSTLTTPSSSSSPSPPSSSWAKWAADKPHPVCNLAAVALGLLLLLVSTLYVARVSPAGRGALLRSGEGCGVVVGTGGGKGAARNCSVSTDGSFAPEGGLSSSVSFAETRDFRGKPRSIVVGGGVGGGGGGSSKNTTTTTTATTAATTAKGAGSGSKGGGGGVVAADHGRCSDLGASVLSRGGNAADAAVAAALCQGVYNPMASGIGGGTIILWRRGRGRRKRKRSSSSSNADVEDVDVVESDEEVIDGRETAPAAASASMFAGKPPAASLDGGLAVAVPLELAALSALYERHGSRKVNWSELVMPAAEVARTGFEAHPYYVSSVSGPRTLEMLRKSPELREAFLVKDEKKKGKKKRTKTSKEEEEGDQWRPPRVGERCCSRPALAETLEAVAREGARDAFYLSRERAEAIADDVRSAGGVLSADDLRGAAPRVARPLRSLSFSRSSSSSTSSSAKGDGSKNSTAAAAAKSPLWGMTLLVPPPPSAGASLLVAAAVAAGFEQPLPFGRGLGSHRLVEAMKHGMALRAALGDDGRGEFVSFGGGGGGGGAAAVAKNCSSSSSAAGNTRRRRRQRSLLAASDAAAAAAAAADSIACQTAPPTPPPPPPPPPIPEGSFEGTAHVRSLLSDAADPRFAAALRSRIRDAATDADPASYGGRWGLAGDGFERKDDKTGGRRRRRKTRRLVSLPPDDHGTSALVVVDADRNAVALTTTVNTAFGSGVYSKRTGVLLNNQMDDFSVEGRPNGYGLAAARANFIEPRKRPLSSMAPFMLLQEEEEEEEGENGENENDNNNVDPTFGLRLVAGASGGPRILTALLQTLFHVVEGGDSALEAVSRPRLHHQLLPAAVFAERWSSGGLTERVDDATLDALERRGHEVKPAGWGAVVQAVVVPAGGGPMEAASDPRKDGAPAAAAADAAAA